MAKKRKKRETDIVQDVINRKRDILSREKTVQRRKKKKETHAEKMKDAIYRETNRQEVVRKDTKISRHVREQKKRSLIISKLTNKSFRCPVCNKVKTEIKSWIISKDKKKCICRSCFSLCKWNLHPESKVNIHKIRLYLDIELRYKLNSLSLCRMREELNLSVEQFSMLVGWSIPFQYKLEGGKFLTISSKIMSEIVDAFGRKGKKIKLNIWGEPIPFYFLEGYIIRNMRKLKKITMKEFATRCGWTSAYQHKIETGIVAKVSKFAFDIIYKELTK